MIIISKSDANIYIYINNVLILAETTAATVKHWKIKLNENKESGKNYSCNLRRKSTICVQVCVFICGFIEFPAGEGWIHKHTHTHDHISSVQETKIDATK